MDLFLIQEAHERLAPYIRWTPVFRANRTPRDPQMERFNLYFKLETLQATGSFKVRGALNKILQTPTDLLREGVMTASGGNHGRAVAFGAHLFKIPAEILVPVTTPQPMIDAIVALGATLKKEGQVLDESAEIGMQRAREKGCVYIHNFKDPEVIAGNGTLGLEILKDLPDVETILVATGGGGMLAGICVAVKAQRPEIKIIGIEPEGAPTLTRSLEAGKIVKLPELNTRAGTLALKTTFPLNFEIIKKYVDGMVLVSDAEMLEAARWLWRRFGIASEISAASVVAALLREKYRPREGEKVCAIICGLGADGMAEGNSDSR